MCHMVHAAVTEVLPGLDQRKQGGNSIDRRLFGISEWLGVGVQVKTMALCGSLWGT